MENFFDLEKLIELGKLWIATEFVLALYLFGMPLIFYIIAGELKRGLEQCDLSAFLDASVVIIIFYIFVYIFLW